MSEEKKVEQDERGELLPCPFCGDKAEYKYNAFHGDNSLAVCRCCGAQAFWSKWQARAASTSANVDRFDPYRLKVAEECCERLMSACTDAGCPDGVRMDDWIRENVRSTSANVAQGAEAVREQIARALHYPACWDTAAYPTLDSAAWEAIACAKLGCSTCGEPK